MKNPVALTLIALGMVGLLLGLNVDNPVLNATFLGLGAVSAWFGAAILIYTRIRKGDAYDLALLKKVHEDAELDSIEEAWMTNVTDANEVICPHCHKGFDAKLPLCPHCGNRPVLGA